MLAAICKTMCLATLSLCFPKSKAWQENIEQEKANDYVAYYLGEYDEFVKKKNYYSLTAYGGKEFIDFGLFLPRTNIFAGFARNPSLGYFKFSAENSLRGMAGSHLHEKS